MIASILLVLGFFLVLPLLLNIFTELDNRQKQIVYAISAAIIGLIIFYQYSQLSEGSRDQEMILAFQQGATLECGGQEVHKDHFNFVSGTLTFVGKPNSPRANSTYQLENCNLLP